MAPADDQAIVLPCTSVMVIMVLLNVEFTWAMPDVMFLRSRLRTRVASLAIVNRSKRVLLLLAGDGLCRALPGARIGVRALAADRQAAPVAQAAVRAEVHQRLMFIDTSRRRSPSTM
jgi:hypothetical protein